MSATEENLVGGAPQNDEQKLLLSEDEQRVLEMYDKLQELQLEIALLQAQKSFTLGRYFFTWMSMMVY
jgi:hypothetical protein